MPIPFCKIIQKYITCQAVWVKVFLGILRGWRPEKPPRAALTIDVKLIGGKFNQLPRCTEDA